MPTIPIENLDDHRIDVYRSLKNTNLTRYSGLFIAEGRRVIERLFASGYAVESVLVSDRKLEQIAPLVPADVPVYMLPIALARQLVGYNFHSGVVACARRKPAPSLESIVSKGNAPTTLVVCPNVNDPDNLGSIIRIASALGVDAMLLGTGCADPLSRRVSRLSMGSCYRLPIIECADLEADLAGLARDWSFQLVATVLDKDAEALDCASRPHRLALLFGNEAHGLDPRFRALCHRFVAIPMQEGTDSLNVAVAAGIILYHFMRHTGGEAP